MGGVRPLFIAGCPRSGTSALTNYLNLHPEVMVAMERYNHCMLITPERFLDVRPEETRQPRERIAALIESKRWESLKWVGDKRPTYFLAYRELLRANPGARFVYIYRPLEEVVESFQEKHERPDDWAFTAHDAVRLWNVGAQAHPALRRIRRRGARRGLPRFLPPPRGVGDPPVEVPGGGLRRRAGRGVAPDHERSRR